jgi:hypothetical protein
MNRKGKNAEIIGLFTLILGSLSCAIVIGENNPIASAEAATRTANSPFSLTPTMVFPDSIIPPEGAFMGDFIAKSGYFFAALELEDPTIPSKSYTPESGSRLVSVLVVFGNQNGKQIMVGENDCRLKDVNGGMHDIESDAKDGSLPIEFVDLGERVKGWISFSLPEDVNPELLMCKFNTGVDTVTFELGITVTPEGHVVLKVNTSRIPPVRSKLGEKVTADGYSLTALKVEDPAESAYSLTYSPQNGWHLAAVQLAVANVGRTEDHNNIDPLEFSLVDMDGYLYSAELFGRTGQIESGVFSLGTEYKGWVSFTIPDGVRLESVKYRNSWVTGLVYAGLAE